MSKDADKRIVAKGPVCRIEYAVCSNRAMPAKDFVNALGERDQRKLDVLFRRMVEHGLIRNIQKFKRVEGKIYEFKAHQVRVSCFQIGDRWVLTHGFIKKGDRWPKQELRRAERIMEEHIEREGAGDK